MARLYQRKGSPFFQIEFRNQAGQLRRESTHLRADKREEVRAAQRLLNKKLSEEKQFTLAPINSAWARWVVPFLEQHCIKCPSTLAIYKSRWVTLGTFMDANSIAYPCQFTREHAFEFLSWRKSGKELSRVSHNTAMGELDLLKMLLNEAVRRDYVLKNPCLKLRIGREARKVKQEISPEDLKAIEHELKNWPDWMTVQFQIGLYSGRRISETRIDLSTVDLNRREYIVRLKGGKTKGKPIHPMLLSLFRQLKETKQKFTHDIPVSQATKEWWKFFRKLQMPYSFHCFRVTMISAGRRAGIDRWTMMQLVDHASATIHEVYNRYSDSDLDSALSKLFPSGIPQIAILPPAKSDCSASEGPCREVDKGSSA
jgi:site-specific recombinase XerD